MLTPGRQYKNGVKLQDTYSVSSGNWRIAQYEIHTSDVRVLRGVEEKGERTHQFRFCWVSLVTQMVKNLPAMQETWV